jgi:vacuolar-type H+-ATPase subunit I/STV1
MTHEDVGRLLRELPAAEASSHFTERVLGKIDRSSPRARARRRAGLLAVAATVVLGVAGVSGYVRHRVDEWRAAERVQALREEYRELQAELEKLRSLAREVEPVLDLGGTEDVEFIFDLRELAREESGSLEATPASHSAWNEREEP